MMLLVEIAIVFIGMVTFSVAKEEFTNSKIRTAFRAKTVEEIAHNSFAQETIMACGNHYRLLEELGRGNSIVYSAELADASWPRIYAIKLIPTGKRRGTARHFDHEHDGKQSQYSAIILRFRVQSYGRPCD